MRKMKDSGIEWIGQIPEEWDLSKIGAIYEERNIKVSDRDYLPLSVTKLGIVQQLETAAKTDNGDNRKLIKRNDFVINSRSDRRGSCGISEYDGSCSLINTVLKPRHNMHNRYYNYVFRSELFADEFYRWGNGIVDDLWSTKWSNMKRIYIPFPSIEIQKHIADFLDDKCGKIDRYIEKQQQIIDKLKEYKQAVITEAVTKGLDPDVPMKDSGIEWIGEIPEHWEIYKFGYLATVKSNLVHPQDYKNYLQVSSENIEKGSGKLLDCKTVDEVGVISDNHLFFKGQILYSKIRPALNKVTIAPFDGLCSADIYPIETKENLKYLVYTILSEGFLEQVRTITETRVKMPKINQNELSGILVAKAPNDEQIEIAKYLDSICDIIDANIGKKQNVIDKLIEYKKSLIYETVTGKLEV